MSESFPPPAELLAQLSWVRGLAARLVRDHAAVDDVVQEALLSALRARRVPRSGWRPWLSGAVRNLERYRQRGNIGRRAREFERSVQEATVPSTA